MAPSLSKIAANPNVAIAIAGCTAATWIILYGKQVREARKQRPEDEIQYIISDKKEKRSATKAQVNAAFFKQLRALLKIIIPRKWSAENGLLVLIAAALIARSISDIWMIQNATTIESTIITMNKSQFRTALVKYLSALPAIAVVNNVLKWSIGELKLRFRTNMSQYLYAEYLKGFTYYKMSNLDNRIANADQLLTTDIDKFCESVTDLYSNICKPLLDIVMRAVKPARRDISRPASTNRPMASASLTNIRPKV